MDAKGPRQTGAFVARKKCLQVSKRSKKDVSPLPRPVVMGEKHKPFSERG